MANEVSGGIIIYKRDKDRDGKIETKYLLLYHGRGYWNFPKGKLEGEERSYDAAIRETAEETGIVGLQMEQNFRVSDKYIYQRNGEKIYKIVVFFLAQISMPKIALSPEHEGFGWFLHKDAQRLLRHQNSRRILKQANDFVRRKSLPQPQYQKPTVPKPSKRG
ncbi:MAG: NUDIX domain-containing protein [bacterium]|nr:NUDIX domain-containing protein [bacterium]